MYIFFSFLGFKFQKKSIYFILYPKHIIIKKYHKNTRVFLGRYKLQESPKFKEIVRELTNGLGQWQRTKTISNANIDRGDLTEANKVWFYFFNSVLTPSKHVSIVRQDRAILLYALIKGCCPNVGKIVEQSILDYAENSFSRNIPHPALITLLCIKGGVTFSKTKEKCPRASPLTLTRVLKTLAHCEEVERARKRKKAGTGLPREATPIAKEELETEEGGGGGGGVDDYPEQLVLSPRAEEIVLAHNIAEIRKRRVEEKGSSNSNLLSLLT